MSGGKSTVSEVASVLIEEIWNSKNKNMSKSEFLTNHFHQFDLEVVEKCITTLEQAELLKQSLNGHNEIHYIITAKCIETFDLKDQEK